jgi:hypothetical protein
MSGASADERVQSLTAKVRGLREDVSRIMDHFGISRAPASLIGLIISDLARVNEVMIRSPSMKFISDGARFDSFFVRLSMRVCLINRTA